MPPTLPDEKPTKPKFTQEELNKMAAEAGVPTEVTEEEAAQAKKAEAEIKAKAKGKKKAKASKQTKATTK